MKVRFHISLSLYHAQRILPLKWLTEVVLSGREAVVFRVLQVCIPAV